MDEWAEGWMDGWMGGFNWRMLWNFSHAEPFGIGFRSNRRQGTIKPRILQLEVILGIPGHISNFSDKETKDQRNQKTS